MEQKTTYTLAEFEALQYRYDQLVEKLGHAQECIEELEEERKGLKSVIADARLRFAELACDCGRMLDQIASHRQHI